VSVTRILAERIVTNNDGSHVAHLKDDDFHHAANVLRLKTGQKVSLLTYDEQSLGDGVIAGFSRITHEISLDDFCLRQPRRYTPPVRLFQVIPHHRRVFDDILKKICEAGVDEIIPLFRNRIPDRDVKKLTSRWNRVRDSAVKQSRVDFFPVLRSPQGVADTMIDGPCRPAGTVYILDPYGKSVITSSHVPVDLIVGDEAGFSEEEVSAWHHHTGAQPVRLNAGVLRSENAALAAITAVRH